MAANIGGWDRILRLMVGGALVIWASTGGPLWALIGLVPLGTALVGFCPLYRLLGVSSCRKGACGLASKTGG